MKKDIHPTLNKITIKMESDGNEGEDFVNSFQTYSAGFSEGHVINIGPDPTKTHPAWTGDSGRISESSDNVATFKSRYGSISMLKKKEK